MSDLTSRVDHLENNMQQIQVELTRIHGRLDVIDARLNTEIPHLATKAEISSLTIRTILWTMGSVISLGLFNWLTFSLNYFHTFPRTEIIAEQHALPQTSMNK